MITLQSLLLFGAGFVSVILGLLVLLRDPKSLNNISFFGLCVGMSGWSIGIAGFLATQSEDLALVWARFYYFFPLVIGLSLVFFVHTFHAKGKIPLSWKLPSVAGFLAIAGLLVAQKNFLFEELVYHDWGKQVVLTNSAYLLYSTYVLLAFGASILYLLQYSKKLEGIYRHQALLFGFGFLIASVLGVLFNLVLPWLNDYRLIWLGPIFTTVVAATVTYSIIKHRMFDIRKVIARSVAYVMSIGLLLVIYILVSSYALTSVLKDIESNLASSLINVLVLTGAVLLYQPQKRFFDKITDRLFYRDSYDPQKFLDELNKVLISNVEIGVLLRHSAKVIEKHMKSARIDFVVLEGDLRVVSAYDMSLSLASVSSLNTSHSKLPKLFMVKEVKKEHSRIYDQLTALDVEAVAQLGTQLHGNYSPTAYMLLGPKKSGNQYSGGDMKIIELIADELVVAIQNALRFEEIQNFNITLQQKVDDATHKLIKTNQKLKEMDATKDDFISMASHQLRTPLTSIKGLLSMVVEGDAGKLTPLQAEMLGQAYTSSQRMAYLIADLLNVSRLKSGKFSIDRHDTDLAAMIEQEVSQLAETAKARKLAITCEKPANFPILQLDETKTRQIVMNFIDNAIYYTPAGGKIRVKLIDKPKSVEVHVIDSGVGVAKRDQPKLFTKFYRANNARSMRPDGTGLGLFMAKKVIIAQGGAIVFKSQEGKGSTFGFSFPKTDALMKPSGAESKN